jgi:predicted phosphoribosyltransferase
LVSLTTPAEFLAVGQFFDDFTQVTDEDVAAILQERNTATEAPR